MQQKFTISIFTENYIGLLNRVTIIFTRRHLNIESITASESEIEGIYRYTIVLECEEHQVKKVVSQLEKLVEVVRAFYHKENEIVFQEIALYKLLTKIVTANKLTETVLCQHHARVLTVEENFTIIEKTGTKEATQNLLNALQKFGVLEFVRSGRVAITKPMKPLSDHLKEIEEWT